LLEDWDGEPLLRRAARALVDGGLKPIVVVISADPRLRVLLRDLPVTPAVNPAPEAGLSSSIRVGLEKVPGSAAALIATADQPYLEAGQVRRLAAEFKPGRIVVSRYGQRTGNPQVFDQRFFAELGEITGDRGGRQVAERHPEAIVECLFERAVGEDIDTPEDWERVKRLR
jgi:molybdenum cofactor cytidylyltransferase